MRINTLLQLQIGMVVLFPPHSSFSCFGFYSSEMSFRLNYWPFVHCFVGHLKHLPITPANTKAMFTHIYRLTILEDKMRDPLSIANVDCLLDTVIALVADCDHESIKRLKNIEAYTSRCSYILHSYRQSSNV